MTDIIIIFEAKGEIFGYRLGATLLAEERCGGVRVSTAADGVSPADHDLSPSGDDMSPAADEVSLLDAGMPPAVDGVSPSVTEDKALEEVDTAPVASITPAEQSVNQILYL